MAKAKTKDSSNQKPPYKKARRKLSGFLIKPRIQIELIISVVIPTIFFGLATSLMIYFQLGDIFDTLFILSDLDIETADSLSSDWSSAIIWLIIFIFIYVLMTSIVCLIHSHRMIGPTQAFTRHLKLLIEGKYKGRIKLREGDYYQNIADLFNELSEKLEIQFERINPSSKTSSSANLTNHYHPVDDKLDSSTAQTHKQAIKKAQKTNIKSRVDVSNKSESPTKPSSKSSIDSSEVHISTNRS